MLSVSLDYPCVIAPLVFSNVYCPMSCVPYVVRFSGLSIFDCPLGILWRVFVLCLVYLMLPVSLDCIFLIALWYSLTFIFPVSCVPYVASFSGLYIFDCPFGILWRLFVLCLVCLMLPVSLDCICWLPLWYSLTCFCPVSCVPYVASFSGLYICDYPFGILWRLFVLCLVYPMLPVSLDCIIVIAPLVFSDVYLSCVMCTLCCQFLWIVHLWLPL
jgi:hypothetical protein